MKERVIIGLLMQAIGPIAVYRDLYRRSPVILQKSLAKHLVNRCEED